MAVGFLGIDTIEGSVSGVPRCSTVYMHRVFSRLNSHKLGFLTYRVAHFILYGTTTMGAGCIAVMTMNKFESSGSLSQHT